MKLLYVIAQEDFRDEEYFIPKEIFERAGIEVTTASLLKGKASGALGGEAEVSVSLAEASMDDHEGIVIAGGKGALMLDGNDDLKRLLFEALKDKKIIGAICISPIILANFGMLQGKSATVWDKDGEQADTLKRQGALYFPESVVEDSNIITANGPDAAEEFGKTILAVLNS